MTETSVLWLRVAAILYSLGLASAILMLTQRRERLFRAALLSFSFGALFHLVSIVEEGVYLHALPVQSIFESMSLCAWIITVAFLIVCRRYRAESLSVFIFPLVFIMTMMAALSKPVDSWSSLAFRNAWLSAHIVSALLAYGALVLTAVAAVVYLFQEKQLKKKLPSGISHRLPPLGTLDELITRSLAIGFGFMTGSLVAGSIWAFIELGTRWIGEPRITISFITWGIYLAMVFFRASAGWRGRKAAIMALVALVCSALTWAAHARLESHLS
jgi:ABC-type uncharacterized transport system permease subunit